MRKRHWLSKLLSGALLAALPAVGWAQPPDGTYVPYIDPNSPQAAGVAPAYGGYEAAGWPQGATQWPYVSPYTAPPLDQTTYQDGFWFNEQNRGSRKYFTYLAATLNTYADPDDVLVGDPDAPAFPAGPNPGVTNNNQNVAAGALNDPAQPSDWSAVEDKLSGGGFYGITGWMNPNDTGVFLTGFWAEEGGAQFKPVDAQGDIDTRTAPDRLLVGPSVPLFDGQGFSDLPVVLPNQTSQRVLGGGAQIYDALYKLAWQSQAYGAGVGFLGSSLYRTETMKLRPVFGMRYLNIRENATFDGINSNFAYSFNQAGGTTGTTTTTSRTIGRPIAGTVQDLGLDPLVSHLRSNTKSQMAGPEVGLAFDLGGDRFRIQLQSKLGILANHSTREIDGFGIGRVFDQATTAALINSDQLDNPIPTDPTQTAFLQQETTTHVSPTFEQSILLSAPILAYVPGVRKVRLFEEANFNIGYTWLVAGAVYRPGNVIDWAGFPNFPTINSDKTTWFLQSVNFGVEWNY